MKRIRAIATSTQQLNKKGQQWFHSPSMVTPCCRSSSKLNKVWNTPRIWHQHRQFSTFVDNDGSTSIFVGTEEEQGCLRGHRQAQQQDEDDDICKKTDRFVNTDASFEEAMIGPRITDGFIWQNLYDEAHEMMMGESVVAASQLYFAGRLRFWDLFLSNPSLPPYPPESGIRILPHDLYLARSESRSTQTFGKSSGKITCRE